MTIQMERGSQTAGHRRMILLPNQNSGDTSAEYTCTLRNIGAGPIDVSQFGFSNQSVSGSRAEGWAVADTNGTFDDFTLASQATRTINMRIMPLSVGNILEAGVYTGVCHVLWRSGSDPFVLQKILFAAIVKDTSLPDLRVTKDDLFSEHIVMQIPCGSAGGSFRGIRQGIIDRGYTVYFTEQIPTVTDWAGLPSGKRIKVFLDRWTGNAASNNAGDVAFDGVIDLINNTQPELDLARDTLVPGFEYLATLACDVMIYMGTLRRDADFTNLADAEDFVALMDRVNRSLEIFMRLPNLYAMIFDAPYGVGNNLLAATSPMNRLYEFVRRVCQARGVSIAAEPRGPGPNRDILRWQDGVGLCAAIGDGTLNNPDWRLVVARDNSGNRPDSTADGLELLQWLDNYEQWQMLAMVAGARIRSHALGRSDSKPKRSVLIPWPFINPPNQGGAGQRTMTAQALTDIVNAYIGVVTGDAPVTPVMDGDVSIAP